MTPLPPERLAPEMRAALERMAREDGPQPDPTTLPPAQARAAAERGNRRWNVGQPEMAKVRQAGTSVGIAANVFLPRNDTGRDAILLIHGGGWLLCSAATHEDAARQLAQESGAAVVTFDYRLAPEHPYPAALEDCLALWSCREEILSGRRWSVAGDSAGANLAVAMMLRLPAPGQPRAGLLFYGVYASDFQSESYVEVADGPGLTRDKMRRYWDFYTPETGRATDPCITPANATDAALAALPPLWLNAAEIDPLRSDTEVFHARLQALGRKDPCRIVPGVIHGFMQMSQWLPQSAEEYARAGAWLRAAD